MPASPELLALARALAKRVEPPFVRKVADASFVDCPRVIPRDEEFREIEFFRNFAKARLGGSRTIAPDCRPKKREISSFFHPSAIELQRTKHLPRLNPETLWPEPSPLRVQTVLQRKSLAIAHANALRKAADRAIEHAETFTA